MSMIKITFDEKRSNMVNFRNEGGVLYVVVKITPDNQKKIYYSKLMPFYINQLLSIYKDRKRVRFQLTLFPTDTKKIEALFFSFLQDRKKQPASLSGHNWTIEHLANIEVGSHEIDVKNSANGKDYYDKAVFERHRSGEDYIKFGKSFEIKFCKNEKVVKFNYSLTGNLDERITAIAFLIDMSNDSGFFIDGGKIEINLDEAKTEIDIEENKHTLKCLKDIKKMLDTVGVKQPMEIMEFTDKEENFIKGLVFSFIYGVNLNFKDKIIPHVATIKFSNIKLALVFEKNENGSYKLYNFFNKECGF